MSRHFITLLFIASILCAVPQIVYAQNIQAFNIDDINFGTWHPGDGTQTSDQFFCVYKDSGNNRWDAVGNGSGAGGAFELTDGGGNILPITWVRIRNLTLTPGVPQTNINGADTTPPADCGGTDNQRFRVRLNNTNLTTAPPGTYTGTITVTVNPN